MGRASRTHTPCATKGKPTTRGWCLITPNRVSELPLLALLGTVPKAQYTRTQTQLRIRHIPYNPRGGALGKPRATKPQFSRKHSPHGPRATLHELANSNTSSILGTKAQDQTRPPKTDAHRGGQQIMVPWWEMARTCEPLVPS